MVEDYLNQIVKTFPQQLSKYYSSDSCLAATRIAIDIFNKLHIKTKPLVVQTWIMNAIFSAKFNLLGPPDPNEALEWLNEGAYSIVVGSRKEPKEGYWPGHLVLIVKDEYLLDLTISQATRPFKNIILQPFWIKVKDVNKDLIIQQNNCTLIYQFFPQDKSYLKTHDFQQPYKRLDAVKECIRLLKS